MSVFAPDCRHGDASYVGCSRIAGLGYAEKTREKAHDDQGVQMVQQSMNDQPHDCLIYQSYRHHNYISHYYFGKGHQS